MNAHLGYNSLANESDLEIFIKYVLLFIIFITIHNRRCLSLIFSKPWYFFKLISGIRKLFDNIRGI